MPDIKRCSLKGSSVRKEEHQVQYCHRPNNNSVIPQKWKLYFKERLALSGSMGTVVNQVRQDKGQIIEARGQAFSFFRSQLILFNSRKKHGLLYSVATAAGLFCIPGILGVMGSETQIQLLIQKTIPPPFITLMIAVGMYILNDLVDADADKANSKKRPIASGLVSKKQAWSFIILTNGVAVGIMLIVKLDLASIILVVPMILIGILYSAPKIA